MKYINTFQCIIRFSEFIVNMIRCFFFMKHTHTRDDIYRNFIHFILFNL